MKTDEIRKRYLDFFVRNSHRLVPSDSLVPQNDPTLLFTGAGMNQFKEEFLGHVSDYRRATTCQKCVRTGDIENVGRTPFHFTFFEMLGNFSFGDYFKREAITWAWQFLMDEMKLDPSLISISIYEDDQEAFDIWTGEAGVPADRIYRYGEHDNFWPADAPSLGPNGVCGPCSEIYVDRKPQLGAIPPEGPAADNKRFVEIWNLVFTQFNRLDGGKLEPLPQRNIDTGMGLERMAAVMQDVPTGQEIDILLPIVQRVAEISGRKYSVGDSGPESQKMKRITDHVRCVSMAIADGALPDRYGRGYVIRRLIRRAALNGRDLGVNEPFLYTLLPDVVKAMGAVYPEVAERRSTIESILKGEEERFAEALGESKGIRDFQDELESAVGGTRKQMDGRRVFYFTDTHGIPLEFIEDRLSARGVDYDREAFEQAMEERRQESRAASTMGEATMVFKSVSLRPEDLSELRHREVQTEFVGYHDAEAEACVLGIVGKDGLQDEAGEGEQVSLVLDKTPFYSRGGGQTGDRGSLTGPDGFAADVLDTFNDHEFRLHACQINGGRVKLGQTVRAGIDMGHRLDTARNHTATHLLQWALRRVLGEHVTQAGSEVSSERLRFDFTHPKALSPEEVSRVEGLVNDGVVEDRGVEAQEMSIEEARKAGAMALFGEKYGEIVRMVAVGEYSRELCGGTHLSNTSQICLLKIVGEESVAAGVRRITAVTGKGAIDFVAEEEQLLAEMAERLKAKRTNMLQRVDSLQEEVRSLKQDLQKARRQASQQSSGDVFANVQDAGGVPVVASVMAGADVAMLREMVDAGRKKLGTGVFVFGTGEGDKATLIVGLTQDLVKRGMSAGKIIKELAPIIGGGGGGRPDMAQAGGKDASKLDEAIAAAAGVVAAQVK